METDQIFILNTPDPKYKKLLDRIPLGMENALSMKQLARLLSCDRRTTRKLVESARSSGLIICSSDEGYYIPETLGEFETYCRRTKARIDTANKSFRTARKKWKELKEEDLENE